MINADRLTPEQLALFHVARTPVGRILLAAAGCQLTRIPAMTPDDAAGMLARIRVAVAVAGLAPEVRQ